MAPMRGTASRWIWVARWVARSMALGVAGLFILFMLESGGRLVPGLSWTDPQGMPLFLVLVVGIAGLFVAWRLEALGGALTVAGALAIMALVYLGSGPAMLLGALFFTLPLLVAGCLYLGCWQSEQGLGGEEA